MLTGASFVILGVLVWLHPEILVAMVAGVLILFGLGMMAASWQFRKFRKASRSRFVNWIIRY
jgi:hypothetical protein